MLTITVEKGKARRVVGTGTVKKSIQKQVGLQKKAFYKKKKYPKE